MWYNLSYTAKTAAEQLDCLVQLINWFSDANTGERVSVKTSDHSVTVTFWTDRDATSDEYFDELNECGIFDENPYDITQD